MPVRARDQIGCRLRRFVRRRRLKRKVLAVGQRLVRAVRLVRRGEDDPLDARAPGRPEGASTFRVRSTRSPGPATPAPSRRSSRRRGGRRSPPRFPSRTRSSSPASHRSPSTWTRSVLDPEHADRRGLLGHPAPVEGDDAVAPLEQRLGEPAADEAAGAGDKEMSCRLSAGSRSQTCQGACPEFHRSLRTTASL